MSLSTSEPVVAPSTSSGLSPQALHDRHAARQRAKQGEDGIDGRPALRRLRRLSELRRAPQHFVLQPEDHNPPSPEPKPLAHLKGSGTEPLRQQAPPEKAPPRDASQQGAPAKHTQRADAPRHLADPLTSKPVMPKKRRVSEVLNLFRGKVSQALAPRKHLKPARLQDSSGARVQDRAMHRQLKPRAAVVNSKAAAADYLAAHSAHTSGQYHREHGWRSKAEALREQHADPYDNSQGLDLHGEAPHGPEEVAEVDQPARCKASQASKSAGAGHRQMAGGAAHTCASTAQPTPVSQAGTQDCRQPPAQMPAAPPEKYTHHLKSFLLHRFCQASGLSDAQAGHPESLQQGIAMLVSALECSASRSCTAANKLTTDVKRLSIEAVRTSAALQRTVQHVSAPSKLCPGKAKEMSKTALPIRVQGRATSDPLFCSPYAAGLQEERRGLSQGMKTSADLWRQQGVDQSVLLGFKVFSPNVAVADPDARLPDTDPPHLEPDDCLDRWMDSMQGSEPSLDRVHRNNNQDGNLRMPSASPEFWLTEDADMADASPGASTLGMLPSSSPRLADALQQYAMDSLPQTTLDASNCADAELEQACAEDIRAPPERDTFLHNLSKGAECRLDASGRSDLQQWRMHQKPRDADPGLDENDEAWLHNAEDLPGNSSILMSDVHVPLDRDVEEPYQLRATHGKLHVRNNSRSSQGIWLEADPDPVAAFAGFCKSLAM